MRVGEWTVTLDTSTVSSGKGYVVYTRMRTQCANVDGFRFTICRENLFSGLKELLGVQDHEFDRQLGIKSNFETKPLVFFSSKKIRLEVKDDEDRFGTGFPEGAGELCFQVKGPSRTPNG